MTTTIKDQLTPEEREHALSLLGDKFGPAISDTFRDLYAAIDALYEREYRLLQALRHIKKVTNSAATPLTRLMLINQAVCQVLDNDPRR